MLEAERDTPGGLLRWRIGVCRDGRRLMAGALPTFISWEERHPADELAASGVWLESLSIAGRPSEILGALSWPTGVEAAEPSQTWALHARLGTPRGEVHLRSLG